MSSIISRRSLLGGLLAAPAVVAFNNLMPIKGVKFDPMIRLQNWPISTDHFDELRPLDWVSFTGPLSKAKEMRLGLSSEFGGGCYLEPWFEDAHTMLCSGHRPEVWHPDVTPAEIEVARNKHKHCVMREEACSKGYGIWQPWSTRGEDQSVLQYAWNHTVERHDIAVTQHEALIEQTRAALIKTVRWGA